MFDDADLGILLPAVEKALTNFTGQFCTTRSRLLVHRPVLEKVYSAFSSRFEIVQLAPASNPASEMGAVVNLEDVRRIDEVVETAIAKGDQVVTRGEPFENESLARGALYRPTLLTISDHAGAMAQEQVSDPVVVMNAFDTKADAVRLANDSGCGLAVSIWSNDVDRRLRIACQIDAGTVWINNWTVVYFETKKATTSKVVLNPRAELRQQATSSDATCLFMK